MPEETSSVRSITVPFKKAGRARSLGFRLHPGRRETMYA